MNCCNLFRLSQKVISKTESNYFTLSMAFVEQLQLFSTLNTPLKKNKSVYMFESLDKYAMLIFKTLLRAAWFQSCFTVWKTERNEKLGAHEAEGGRGERTWKNQMLNILVLISGLYVNVHLLPGVFALGEGSEPVTTVPTQVDKSFSFSIQFTPLCGIGFGWAFTQSALKFACYSPVWRHQKAQTGSKHGIHHTLPSMFHSRLCQRLI